MKSTDKSRWQHYYWSDPEKRKERLARNTRSRRRAMRRKGIKPEMNYINSERGYMKGLWSTVLKTRCRKTGTLFDLPWEDTLVSCGKNKN